MKAWRDAGPEVRTGVCLEILDRLHARVFELANAVQHTSGQAFVMAFQAGGAHALDRALEAIAYAWAEMTRTPRHGGLGEARQGEPLRMEKTFTVVPRGRRPGDRLQHLPDLELLARACSPRWSPATRSSSSRTPPRCCRWRSPCRSASEVLAEAGFDPHLVTLAAEDPDDKLAATLAVRPEVKLIDFTGGNAFGDWLEENARQATVFTEKAGVNTVVVDSTDVFEAMCQNLAFSFALYTGQMCTAPQNVYLPADGIETDEGRKSVGRGRRRDRRRRSTSCSATTPARSSCSAASSTAACSSGSTRRLDRARCWCASRAVTHPAYADATVRTPTIIGLTAADSDVYEHECFGPVAYLIATADTDESIRPVPRHGAAATAR